MYVVSVVGMGVYLVCLAGSGVLFFAAALLCRLPSGVCVGLCGVFCVWGGFVLLVCCRLVRLVSSALCGV